MKNKPWIKKCILILTVGFVSITYLWERGHWALNTKNMEFTESARELNNPERGFYHIYGFRIMDVKEDYETLVKEKFQDDIDTKLSMIQISLQEYRERDISERGLKNIDQLFRALEQMDRKYIVRFLYDWNGENILYEPENIDLILKHMEQVSSILNKYSHKIYVLQGLFIGNWGEMNGTRYSSQNEIETLALQLLKHTDDSIYLSVRTPQQWRMSMKIQAPSEIEEPSALRIGLYNDAIMGNEGDYGTYLIEGSDSTRKYGVKDRTTELMFQSELGCYVPNGGEVIADNPLNDFENAIDTLRQMRISYLNGDYDRKVLDKWEDYRVKEDSVYEGLSGLEYIERHMGYRFLIDKAQLEYACIKDELTICIFLKNVGFAPVYHDKKMILTVCDEEGEVIYTSEFRQDLSTLYGGENADEILELKQTFSVFGWDSSQYEFFFSIQDEYSGEIIMLANEQNLEKYGYKIGTVTGGIR